MTTELNNDQAAALLHLSTVYCVGDTVKVKGLELPMCVQAIVWSQRFKCGVVECVYFDARVQLQIECFKPEMLLKKRGGQ